MALPNEVNVGTAPNNGTGDPLRTGGQKINANFVYLEANKEDKANKGAANGYVGLNANVKIGNEYIQMPVIPVETVPATGEGNVLYTESSTANLKIWNGTEYVIYGGGSISYQDVVDALGFVPEPDLGNPVSNDMVLASDTAGNRYWVVQESSGGGVTQQYVDDADAATLASAETYADSGDSDLQLRIDDVEDDFIVLNGEVIKGVRDSEGNLIAPNAQREVTLPEGIDDSNVIHKTGFASETKEGDLTIIGKHNQAFEDDRFSEARPVMNDIVLKTNPSSEVSQITDFHGINILHTSEGENLNNQSRLYPFEIQSINRSSGNLDRIVCAYLIGENDSQGYIDEVMLLRLWARNRSSGDIIDFKGIGISNPVTQSTGNINNAYGIYIADIDVAEINNYGIFSLANNYFNRFQVGTDDLVENLNSEFINGVESNRLIFGANASGTTLTSDCNLINKSGFYTAGSSSLNTPVSGNWGIFHCEISNGLDYAVQLAISFTNSSMYKRCKDNGSWGDWIDTSVGDTGGVTQAYVDAADDALSDRIDDKADNADVLHTTGNETKTGDLTIAGKLPQTYTDTRFNSIRNPVNDIDFLVNPSGTISVRTDFHGIDLVQTTAGVNINDLVEIYPLQISGKHATDDDIRRIVNLYNLIDNTGNGNVSALVGNQIWGRNRGTGVVTDFQGILIRNPVNDGGGSIINSYGIYIDNFTTATNNNYGIYSLAGNYFRKIEVSDTDLVENLNAEFINGISKDRLIFGDNSSGSSFASDCNEIVKSGSYSTTTSSQNIPYSGNFSIYHTEITSGLDYATQIAVNYEYGDLHVRSKNNGVWTTWNTITSEESLTTTPRLYTAQQGFKEFALTDAANVTWNANTAQVARLQATSAVGNTRTITISNSNPGVNYQLTYIQDATGGRELDLSEFDKVYGSIDLTANAESIITVCVTNAGTSFVVITSDVSVGIDNITEIPNRSYNDLQDLPFTQINEITTRTEFELDDKNKFNLISSNMLIPQGVFSDGDVLMGQVDLVDWQNTITISAQNTTIESEGYYTNSTSRKIPGRGFFYLIFRDNNWYIYGDFVKKYFTLENDAGVVKKIEIVGNTLTVSDL